MGVLGQPCVVLYLVGNVHQNVAKLLKAVIFLRQCLREDVCALLSRSVVESLANDISAERSFRTVACSMCTAVAPQYM